MSEEMNFRVGSVAPKVGGSLRQVEAWLVGGSKLNEILVEATSFGGQKQKTSSAKKGNIKKYQCRK